MIMNTMNMNVICVLCVHFVWICVYVYTCEIPAPTEPTD